MKNIKLLSIVAVLGLVFMSSPVMAKTNSSVNNSPLVYDVKILNVKESSVEIEWKSIKEEQTYIIYWKEGQNKYNGEFFYTRDNGNTFNHRMIISGLDPNTTYSIKLTSKSATPSAGISVGSAYTFRTIKKPMAQKPDLTVTSITFSTNYINQTGTIAVTIKNVGNKPLTSTQGLLSTYFNLPFQSPNWQFDPQTPMMSLMTTRPLPTPSYPLMPGESISRLWLGKFTQAGNYYMHYTVDNGNELDELNENNNTLSSIISVN